MTEPEIAPSSKPETFPSVPPEVYPESYEYTLYGRDGVVLEVTSAAPSVKELWAQLFPQKGQTGAVIERTPDGRHAYFPEAVVEVERLGPTGQPEPVVQIEAGWIDDEDPDDPEALPPGPPRDEEPEPRRRTPKLFRRQLARQEG